MNNKFDALKDDDSGDQEQHENNHSQKENEKEKTDKEKTQNITKRKAVVPGPGEHPLQYNYTFWYSRRTPGRPTSSQSYEQNVKQIGTFASVEQFWRFYSHLVRPGDLTGHSDFHLFKDGIKPMWEEDIISIWNKTACDQATTARIRDTLRRVLNLPPNTIMEYKTHTDSIKIKPRFRDARKRNKIGDLKEEGGGGSPQGDLKETIQAFEIQKSHYEISVALICLFGRYGMLYSKGTATIFNSSTSEGIVLSVNPNKKTLLFQGRITLSLVLFFTE
ncbi:eukaryotic translation initiation factor 4E type 2 isoform X3 [Rhinoraja longicauda]